MSVLRLIVPNKPAIYYPFVLYNFAKSCQLFLILRNCRPSSFTSCLNCCHHNQALKFYKEINSNYKIGFKYYSHAKLSESNYSAENVESKIIYNSVVKYRGFIAEKRAQLAIKKKQKNVREVNCVALKYLYDESLVQPDCSSLLESDNYKEEPKLNLPYSIHGTTLNNEANFKSAEDNKEKSDINITREDNNYDDNIKANFDTLINDNTKATHKNWMFDYECYRDSEDLDEEYDDHDWKLNYGTSDPNIPVSQVPCGGCGALLHCQDPAIPGYLPVELFGQLKATDLRAVSCQRCHFLKEYNTALAINVDPNEYPKILSQIKDKKALVILMVDMTDFPCSIWPGLLDIIGSKRPIFVVGNKIDLLQGDSKHWLERAQKALEAAIPVNAHVKHVSLISAKTGFGIEELINKLFNLWEYRGDVYLVGCTNVGKSTLFNALLQSDYCKVKAVDLLQRATTSPWPGTTLNLLKFPIMRPEGWKLYYRTKRLLELSNILHQEKKLLQQQKKTLKGRSQKESIQLIGHVGRTFKDANKLQEHKADPFSVLNKKELGIPTSGSGLDPNDQDFIRGHWLYDTPGTVQPDQIINLLTIDELMITLPKQTIIPRTFQIQPNQSLFIGGLGRLDYVSGEKKLKFTVCASAKLPITVCRTEDAAELYNHYLGTKVLGVPFGDENRMKAWPGLLPGQEFVLRGVTYKESCADVVLSSAGWVAVTPGPQMICKFLAWTPQARGIHVRIPPVLPYVIKSHGNIISSTIAYSIPK